MNRAQTLIKFSNLTCFAIQNKTIRIPGSYMFVYQYKGYVQVSKVDFSNIARACKCEVSERREAIFQCHGGEGHDNDLLPFFYCNPQLTLYYRVVNGNNTSTEQRRANLQKFTDCIVYVESSGD